MTTAPSDIEYGVIIQHRNQAEQQLSELRFQARLELEESPSRSQSNLLEFLTRGQAKRLTGRNLREAIEATERTLAVADLLLADFNARQEAYFDSIPSEAAADPEPTDSEEASVEERD